MIYTLHLIPWGRGRSAGRSGGGLESWKSPKPFELALKGLNVKPEEALMIGDWPERDVVGAGQIGMKTVFARYGDTFNTIDSGANYDVNDIYELVGIIDELNDV